MADLNLLEAVEWSEMHLTSIVSKTDRVDFNYKQSSGETHELCPYQSGNRVYLESLQPLQKTGKTFQYSADISHSFDLLEQWLDNAMYAFIAIIC